MLGIFQKAHQINLPMAKILFILNLFWSFMNRDSIRNTAHASSFALSQSSLCFVSSQKFPQLILFLLTPVYPGINTFMADGSNIRLAMLQPCRNLLWGPIM